MATALQIQHDEEAQATSLAVVKRGDVDVPVVSNTPKPKRPKRVVNKGPILLCAQLYVV